MSSAKISDFNNDALFTLLKQAQQELERLNSLGVDEQSPWKKIFK